ncbi:hypothetical protein B1757_14700 [Acidithiobacillus marinus]|uniref:Lipoprotein n=1 Tax=Acidithiobacillus marinus TaxID=187490 RepID=A0A2I1DHY9_9PROT|nr:hypothetical protein [Acidithiobacillus marinus]PKY09485.1 hypothetical protein B1757_14700 [Acidithiobacillus marinus]
MNLSKNHAQKIFWAASALALAALSGCANTSGTVAPPMPLAMNQAQAQANVKQAGINVSRQFVGQWTAAKSTMKNDLEQCSLSASSGYGSQRACWENLQNQSQAYARQFAGMSVSGLTAQQLNSFELAKASAVNFFHFTARYATACSVSMQNCMRQNALRMKMDSERKSVDDYLMGTRVAPSSEGGAIQYENNSVNNNLETMRTPDMVPPAANQPKIQGGSQ